MLNHPNTPRSSHGYDRSSRALHWISAAAILMLVPLGLWMIRLPANDDSAVRTVFLAYSIHKTLGVVVLAIAALRIATLHWRHHPGDLHPERRVENALAHLVHSLLLMSLVVLPLTGLAHHYAAPGFAPILWPFNQTSALIPEDEGRALMFRNIHSMSGWLLIGALLLHVAGVLKHSFLDRDATLSRMVNGVGPGTADAVRRPATGLLATAIWACLVAYAVITAPQPEPDVFDIFNDQSIVVPPPSGD